MENIIEIKNAEPGANFVGNKVEWRVACTD
jgi:hypothetical protein